MFDSIVGARQRAERRLGAGALLSIALHGAAVAIALWLPTRANAPAGPVGVEVAFLAAPSLETSGASAAAGEPAAVMKAAVMKTAAAPPASETEQPKTERTAAPRKPRSAKPERTEHEPEPEPRSEAAAGTAPAASSAPAAGSAATQSGTSTPGSAPLTTALAGQNTGAGRGAQPGAGPGTIGSHRYEILPFGPGMTRPQLLAGRDPVYTRAARMARVEGTVIARCVITIQGRLEKCRIIKGQPHMDDAVLQALATRRYQPVTFQGHVQAVLYNVTVVLRMRE